MSRNNCLCGPSFGSEAGSRVAGIVVEKVVASDSFGVAACTAASSEVERHTAVGKVETVVVVVQMVVVQVVNVLKASVAFDSLLHAYQSFV